MADIQHVQEKVGKVLSMGRILLFLDCAAFSGENIEAGRRVWTNSREPIRPKPGTDGGGYVAMIAACSATDGVLHYGTKYKAGYRQDDVVAFFK